MVNWERIERDWKRFKVPAKRNWDRLSENELLQINGNRHTLCSKVQQAYGIGKNEAELQVDEWASGQEPHRMADQLAGTQTQTQTQRQSGF